jgi:predicted dehydrogenase
LLEDCSPAVDCGVHYFDVVQWITGSRITEVTGFGSKTQDDVPRDNFNLITFRLENGCSGFYEVGWGQSIRSCNVKEFIGTKGRITLDMQRQRGQDDEEGDRITVYHSDTGVYETVNVMAVYKDMYAQVKALIKMIECDTPGNPTIDDVWRAFRVAQAAEESVETGKTVYISDT